MDEVDLAQVRLRGVSGHSAAMLHRNAGMGVALNPQSKQQCDLFGDSFAEAVLRVTAHRYYRRLAEYHHSIVPCRTTTGPRPPLEVRTAGRWTRHGGSCRAWGPRRPSSRTACDEEPGPTRQRADTLIGFPQVDRSLARSACRSCAGTGAERGMRVALLAATPTMEDGRGLLAQNEIGPSRRPAESVTHHPPAQGRRGHHLVTGVEEHLQQPD